MNSKSRAEYFKQRRTKEGIKSFNVSMDKDKLDKFEKKLSAMNKTKTEWLNEKIDEALNEE